jgi:hypothetical protein
MTNFNYIVDPGHGWIEVPMELVDQLGLRNKISKYSYKNRIDGIEKAFLEEDCDAELFMNAYGRDKINLVLIDLTEESVIRQFNHFTP